MAWVVQSPLQIPPGREGAGIAPYKNTAVMFGGDDGLTTLGDTWTWNGTKWANVGGLGPSARTNPSMAYFPDAGMIVIWGGCANTILTCTTPTGTMLSYGGTWNIVIPNGGTPLARTGAAMAYDQANHRMIVFGGFDGVTYLNDTWALTYNGGQFTWTQLSVTGPTARAYAGAGADASGQIVLFGGYDGTRVLGDTWIWNGTSWSLAPSQTPAPSARQLAAMTSYNNTSGSGLVLFGGINGALGSGTPQGDTWGWNGTSWSQLPAGSSAPSARYDAAASDDGNGHVVLFGGDDGTNVLRDTWLLG